MLVFFYEQTYTFMAEMGSKISIVKNIHAQFHSIFLYQEKIVTVPSSSCDVHR